MDYVKVPKIYWEYTTPQVLTMEYVPGIKISRIKALDELGVDRKRLGRYAVESFLEQILSHGFFHADPHPGNIVVDDVNGGRLIFYDFGMMGSITPNIREGLLEAFYGIYEKDPDKVLDAMIQTPQKLDSLLVQVCKEIKEEKDITVVDAYAVMR